MKKLVLYSVLTIAFTMLFCTAAYAGVTIDKSNVAKGYVTVKLDGAAGKTIKAQVEKGGEKYIYTLSKPTVNLPLQMGVGDYKVTVLENVGGDKYKAMASEAVKADTIDEAALYTTSIPIVEYGASAKAIPAYKDLTKDKKTTSDKVTAVYNDIVKNYSYDFDKVSKVASDYVPVIDQMYADKKGICYDYAAILGGTLRSQGIPTKLVMGYVPEISTYHAWNEILIDGKWIPVDSTYDAQMAKAGKAYTMEKDKTKMKVVKTY